MASPLQYKLAQINCHVLQDDIFNLLFHFLNDHQAEPGRLSETKPMSKPELHCIIQNTAVFPEVTLHCKSSIRSLKIFAINQDMLLLAT